MAQSNLTNLYEQDFQEWLEKTTTHLRDHNFEAIDIEHLIQELNDLGNSNRLALESNLTILLAHLLKLTVQFDAPDTMKNSWYNSIDEHRQHIKKQLDKNPSLISSWETAVLEAYPDARRLAIREGQRAKFGVAIHSDLDYPVICPFAQSQILDDDFYGEFNLQ